MINKLSYNYINIITLLIFFIGCTDKKQQQDNDANTFDLEVYDVNTFDSEDIEQDHIELQCLVSPDPLPAESVKQQGYYLTRDFLYSDPYADDEIIKKAATLNALETILYFQYIPELPEVEIKNTEIINDKLRIEYVAKFPYLGNINSFTNEPVPMYPLETHKKIIHNELINCPDDSTLSGLQNLQYYLFNFAPSECLDSIELTSASIEIKEVEFPKCNNPLPSYYNWLSDCKIYIAMFFNRYSDEPAPGDFLFLAANNAKKILIDGTTDAGVLIERENTTNLDGIEWSTFEASCIKIGGVDCIDLQIDIVKRDQNHADQINPESPFWNFASELISQADIIYWGGHGFRGIAFDGLKEYISNNYQLIFFHQCSSLSNNSSLFFSQKEDFNNLNIIGSRNPIETNPEYTASTLLKYILDSDTVNLVTLITKLKEIITEEDYYIVGSLNNPCQNN